MKELMSLAWPSYIYEWASPRWGVWAQAQLVKVVETVNGRICPRTANQRGRLWNRSVIAGFLAARWYEDSYSLNFHPDLSSPEHKQVQRWGKKKSHEIFPAGTFFKMMPTVGVSSRLCALTHRARCHLQLFIPKRACLCLFHQKLAHET